jgi:hypothetical protein
MKRRHARAGPRTVRTSRTTSTEIKRAIMMFASIRRAFFRCAHLQSLIQHVVLTVERPDKQEDWMFFAEQNCARQRRSNFVESVGSSVLDTLRQIRRTGAIHQARRRQAGSKQRIRPFRGAHAWLSRIADVNSGSMRSTSVQNCRDRSIHSWRYHAQQTKVVMRQSRRSSISKPDSWCNA